MTTWKEKFEKEAFPYTGDKIEDLVFNVSDVPNLLNTKFDDGFGGAEGEPFIAWSKDYVYFSNDYDGADYIEHVLRNPPTP